LGWLWFWLWLGFWFWFWLWSRRLIGGRVRRWQRTEQVDARQIQGRPACTGCGFDVWLRTTGLNRFGAIGVLGHVRAQNVGGNREGEHLGGPNHGGDRHMTSTLHS
jgi:hypothetical protein